jgi:HAD superfamily hydrolase (TIGR01490 family)
MNQPFAVFDIDGTLIRWQLYHALGDELVRMGIISKSDYQIVRDARMQWKKRSTPNQYKKYETTLVKIVERAMIGLRVVDLETAYEGVIGEYKDQAYAYTRDLITSLKAKNYIIFAISGSHNGIVAKIAEHYGFDDYRGTTYGLKDGVITGLLELVMHDLKPQKLKELIEKHNCRWENSIAVGDSESDIPILETVENPIAFNPTKKLFEYAKANGWKVVVERKNMIYELEPNDGKYQLV